MTFVHFRGGIFLSSLKNTTESHGLLLLPRGRTSSFQLVTKATSSLKTLSKSFAESEVLPRIFGETRNYPQAGLTHIFLPCVMKHKLLKSIEYIDWNQPNEFLHNFRAIIFFWDTILESSVFFPSVLISHCLFLCFFFKWTKMLWLASCLITC